MSETSTKPYLLRAIYEWCTDNGYTPYLAVMVDGHTRVPKEFVKNGEIVLNISFSATSGLKMENDSIHFSARFGGVSREISVPVGNVLAIYARENGQGMAFEVTRTDTVKNKPPQKPAEDAGSAARNSNLSLSATAPALTSVPVGQTEAGDTHESDPPDNSDPPKTGGRPRLTRIK